MPPVNPKQNQTKSNKNTNRNQPQESEEAPGTSYLFRKSLHWQAAFMAERILPAMLSIQPGSWAQWWL